MLTTTQIEARRGKLTASRIACLMTGDAAEVLRLWQEMVGEAEPENLDHIWAVRLGEATEQLNLEWYESKNGPLSRRGEVVVHPDLPWAACTLDAWIVDLACPIECKHVGGREPLDPVLIDRYQPQMQWQMEVSGADQCALSVIMGANEPVIEFVGRDPLYAAEMVRRGRQFMQHVNLCIPPVVLPPVPPPIDASKIYDMAGNAEWYYAAEKWKQTFGAAQTAREQEKVLKSMVPADAKKAFGAGVRITRDRAGRLSLREDT